MGSASEELLPAHAELPPSPFPGSTAPRFEVRPRASTVEVLLSALFRGRPRLDGATTLAAPGTESSACEHFGTDLDPKAAFTVALPGAVFEGAAVDVTATVSATVAVPIAVAGGGERLRRRRAAMRERI
eukprot:1715561-Pleurochrysis_carterae.AAC.5